MNKMTDLPWYYRFNETKVFWCLVGVVGSSGIVLMPICHCKLVLTDIDQGEGEANKEEEDAVGKEGKNQEEEDKEGHPQGSKTKKRTSLV